MPVGDTRKPDRGTGAASCALVWRSRHWSLWLGSPTTPAYAKATPPPGCAAPRPHHPLQGLPAQGRLHRQQFPGVRRTEPLPHIPIPDRGRRVDPRQARLLFQRRLSAALRLAGGRGTDRPDPRDCCDRPRTGRRHPGQCAVVGRAPPVRAFLVGGRVRGTADRGARRRGLHRDVAGVPHPLLYRFGAGRDRRGRDGAAAPDGVLVRFRPAGEARVGRRGGGQTVAGRPARARAAASAGGRARR